MYDVMILNLRGVWVTDTTTGSKYRAEERAKFLIPRTPATKVLDRYGKQLAL